MCDSNINLSCRPLHILPLLYSNPAKYAFLKQSCTSWYPMVFQYPIAASRCNQYFINLNKMQNVTHNNAVSLVLIFFLFVFFLVSLHSGNNLSSHIVTSHHAHTPTLHRMKASKESTGKFQVLRSIDVLLIVYHKKGRIGLFYLLMIS